MQLLRGKMDRVREGGRLKGEKKDEMKPSEMAPVTYKLSWTKVTKEKKNNPVVELFSFSLTLG